MSEPWGSPDNVCPKCGSPDVIPPGEDSWAECNDCGQVQYDPETLALQREVQREQADCKLTLGYVPTYVEARKRGLAKCVEGTGISIRSAATVLEDADEWERARLDLPEDE